MRGPARSRPRTVHQASCGRNPWQVNAQITQRASGYRRWSHRNYRGNLLVQQRGRRLVRTAVFLGQAQCPAPPVPGPLRPVHRRDGGEPGIGQQHTAPAESIAKPRLHMPGGGPSPATTATGCPRRPTGPPGAPAGHHLDQRQHIESRTPRPLHPPARACGTGSAFAASSRRRPGRRRWTGLFGARHRADSPRSGELVPMFIAGNGRGTAHAEAASNT